MNQAFPTLTLREIPRCFLTLFGMMAVLYTGEFTGLAEEPKKLEPVPIYLHLSMGDVPLLSFRKHPQDSSEQSSTSNTPFFYAIQSLKWPNGLIPIYQTKDKKTKQWKLTKRLTHGKENFTDPLFFALPLATDSEAGKLSGRWACEAIHRDGSIDFLHWEIGLDGETIFGRFDQDTDYRFAWLTGGRFKSPIIHIKAEYIDAKYELEGSLESNTFQGTWKQTENADGGTWTAEPAYPIRIPSLNWKTATLFITRDQSTGEQIMTLKANPMKEFEPVCKIWLQNDPLQTEKPHQD